MKLAKKLFAGFMTFILALLVYLIVIIFFPILSVPRQPIVKKKRGKGRPQPPASRQNVQYSVNGQTISAWLYLPEKKPGPLPCLVMSHGFGGAKDFGLEKYALRFNEAGYAVLTYDYRHFGASEGEPRQLYDRVKQLEDVRASVAYVRRRPEIDPEKIVLWGTSASGGYGLVVAAEDDKIAGIIAQCAGLDHDADSKLFMEREGWGHFLKLFVHAQRDKGRSRFDLSPHTYPIVGKPGTIAMLTAPGALAGYTNLVQESETFKNEVCARALLLAHGPDPSEAARQVQCPALFLVCEQDNLVAPTSHVKAVDALGEKATVKTYPIGHFDIYEGAHFETAVNDMLAFLRTIFAD
jgi:hypothetical protein